MTKSEPRASRFYYTWLVRAIMRGFAVLGFVIGISLTAGGIAVILRVLAGVAAFAYLYVTWHYGGNLGVEVRPDGIHVRRWFRLHFIPWHEIKTFRIKRPALSPPVFVELISGEMRMLPLTQGRQTRWKHGKSRDTVAVLNAELEQAQKRGTSV